MFAVFFLKNLDFFFSEIEAGKIYSDLNDFCVGWASPAFSFLSPGRTVNC